MIKQTEKGGQLMREKTSYNLPEKISNKRKEAEARQSDRMASSPNHPASSSLHRGKL